MQNSLAENLNGAVVGLNRVTERLFLYPTLTPRLVWRAVEEFAVRFHSFISFRHTVQGQNSSADIGLVQSRHRESVHYACGAAARGNDLLQCDAK